MIPYTADFETTRRGDRVAVWLADLCDMSTYEHMTYTSIDNMMAAIDHDMTLYFHNLKFDGAFLVDWLLNSGYEWTDVRPRRLGEFTFLITDTGKWFSGCIYHKNGMTIKLYDSLKKIPLKVEQIAKAYKLPLLKGSIDYTAPRPEGYQPTEEEVAYIHNDTEIVARALNLHFEQGLTQMTAPADALMEIQKTVVDSYKKLGFQFFRQHPEADEFCRRAYVGGISWVNPLIEGREVGAGMVFDVNSLYPYVMRRYPYPVYYPVRMYSFPPPVGNLWIAEFKLHCERIPGKLPTLRSGFNWTDYFPTDMTRETVVLTSVDYEMLHENYIVYECEFITGYMWRHSDDRLFEDFVSYWGARKEEHTDGLRQIDKLMMNSGYGKFGANPKRGRKNAAMHPLGYVAYPIKLDEKPGKCNNVAIAAFITAYARRELSRGIESSTGFCYCDTDSVHLATYKNPVTGRVEYPTFDGDVDSKRIGAWKLESTFSRAKYLRQKTYIEEQRYNDYEVKACGMPENIKNMVTWESFRMGASFSGKLVPVIVPGGCELVERDFTIHETRFTF